MPSKDDLSKYRLDRAHELLNDAHSLFNSGSYKSSNNRAYYSIFYAIRALFAQDMIEFKKHTGNIQYFLKEYIKTNRLDKGLSEIVLSASKIRSASDYDDFYIASKEDAAEQIDNAEIFLKSVEDFLLNKQ